jgi:hypothetical protein
MKLDSVKQIGIIGNGMIGDSLSVLRGHGNKPYIWPAIPTKYVLKEATTPISIR